MFLRLTNKLICFKINFSAVLLKPKRNYFNFGKTSKYFGFNIVFNELWVYCVFLNDDDICMSNLYSGSTTWLKIERRPQIICVRFVLSKNEHKITSTHFRWKLLGGILIGLCIVGCVTIKFFLSENANSAEVSFFVKFESVTCLKFFCILSCRN